MCPPASLEQGQRAEILPRTPQDPKHGWALGAALIGPISQEGRLPWCAIVLPGRRHFPFLGWVEGSDRPAWVVTAEAVPAVEREACPSLWQLAEGPGRGAVRGPEIMDEKVNKINGTNQPTPKPKQKKKKNLSLKETD